MTWAPIDTYAAQAGQPLDALRAIARNAEAIRAGRPQRAHMAWPVGARPILASADARARLLCYLPADLGDVEVTARWRGEVRDGDVALGLLAWAPGDPPPRWAPSSGVTVASTDTQGALPAVAIQGRGGPVGLYLVSQSARGYASGTVHKRPAGTYVDSDYRSIVDLGAAHGFTDDKRYGVEVQIDSAGTSADYGPPRAVIYYSPSGSPSTAIVAPPLTPQESEALDSLAIDVVSYELGLLELASITLQITAPAERSTAALATGRAPRARAASQVAGALTAALRRAPVRGAIACADPTRADTAGRLTGTWGALLPLESYAVLTGTWATGTTYQVTITDGTTSALLTITAPADLAALYAAIVTQVGASAAARRLVTATNYGASVGVYLYPRTLATLTVTTAIVTGSGTLTATWRRDVCAGVVPVTGVSAEAVSDLRTATPQTVRRASLRCAFGCLATGADGEDETLTLSAWLRLSTWSGSAWATDPAQGAPVEFQVQCLRARRERHNARLPLAITHPVLTPAPLHTEPLWSTLLGTLPLADLDLLTQVEVGITDPDPSALRRCELWIRGAWLSDRGARATLASPRHLHVWGATVYSAQEVIP